jgi:hypothetical protein
MGISCILGSAFRTDLRLQHGSFGVHRRRPPSITASAHRASCSSQRAAGIRPKRDVDGPHPPAIDHHPLKESNASARIPRGAVDDPGVIPERARRRDDDEVLIIRFARTNNPLAPGFRATPLPFGADDVQLTAALTCGRHQALRHARRRDVVALAKFLFPQHRPEHTYDEKHAIRLPKTSPRRAPDRR